MIRRILLLLLSLALASCGLRRTVASVAPVATSSLNTDEVSGFNAAADYSEKSGGVSMLVWRDGEVIYERYSNGTTAKDAHTLHSGTKSFSCSIAVSAATDGLLTFDERVADTITEWAGNPRKALVTIRQLISLSSGLDGGTVGDTPTYTEALDFKMVSEPGKSFHYGPVPFQVFGELMKRKLNGESPLDYLKQKVFDPIGLTYDSWDFTSDGEPHIPNGVHLTAREWVKYGVLILNKGNWNGQQVLDPSLLAECFVGSAANPAYGMSWWLPAAEGGDTSPEGLENGTTGNDPSGSRLPTDLIQASGAQGQRMFIIPSLGVVIVRQAEPGLQQAAFSNAKFLGLMVSGPN